MAATNVLAKREAARMDGAWLVVATRLRPPGTDWCIECDLLCVEFLVSWQFRVCQQGFACEDARVWDQLSLDRSIKALHITSAQPDRHHHSLYNLRSPVQLRVKRQPRVCPDPRSPFRRPLRSCSTEWGVGSRTLQCYVCVYWHTATATGSASLQANATLGLEPSELEVMGLRTRGMRPCRWWWLVVQVIRVPADPTEDLPVSVLEALPRARGSKVGSGELSSELAGRGVTRWRRR
mmetsp:Transcript_971/g.2122  ORF Transcript_971/g.2122 Transcript_971/m.2122 type:complete len:236 (+) Transcript_971:568-1275(+)